MHRGEEVMTGVEFTRSQHRRRVLCVDDNEFSVFVNATILSNEGYEVLACSDPLLAALIAKSEELDLAILDYEMPAMNGAELAAYCKAANPDIKVIVFSGALGVPIRELTFADRWMKKANSVEMLLETMETLLAPGKAQSLVSRMYGNERNMEQ